MDRHELARARRPLDPGSTIHVGTQPVSNYLGTEAVVHHLSERGKAGVPRPCRKA